MKLFCMIHGGYMTKPTELTKQRVKQYKLWTLVNNGFISGLLILTYKPHKYKIIMGELCEVGVNVYTTYSGFLKNLKFL